MQPTAAAGLRVSVQKCGAIGYLRVRRIAPLHAPKQQARWRWFNTRERVLGLCNGLLCAWTAHYGKERTGGLAESIIINCHSCKEKFWWRAGFDQRRTPRFQKPLG